MAKRTSNAKRDTVSIDIDASSIDILKEANLIAAKVDIVDMVPLQQALQTMADTAVQDICQTLGVKAIGRVLINPDYVYARRSSVVGHFQVNGWADVDGSYIHHIGINPYDIQHRTLAQIYGTIYHEVIHFIASDANFNKPLLGIPDGQSDTSRQGRYHGKNFQNITTRLPILSWTPDKKIGCITNISEIGEQFVADNFPTLDIFKIGKVMEDSGAKYEKSTRLD